MITKLYDVTTQNQELQKLLYGKDDKEVPNYFRLNTFQKYNIQNKKIQL